MSGPDDYRGPPLSRVAHRHMSLADIRRLITRLTDCQPAPVTTIDADTSPDLATSHGKHRCGNGGYSGRPGSDEGHSPVRRQGGRVGQAALLSGTSGQARTPAQPTT
ncbi:hypothetical protein GCM10010348_01450 [Streptomyces anthocyanicus]|nr:hypothetical protein GCM10010348_01450 [Streptomyces anthocyanicus]